METLIGLVILFLIFGVPGIIRNYKFNNRLPPDGYRVDYGEMNHDLAMGKSKNEVIDKCNRGVMTLKSKYMNE